MNTITNIDIEQAIGQSRLVKNSFQSTLPNVSTLESPSSSGMANSPIDIEKTKKQLVIIALRSNGIITFQNVFVGVYPKS